MADLRTNCLECGALGPWRFCGDECAFNYAAIAEAVLALRR